MSPLLLLALLPGCGPGDDGGDDRTPRAGDEICDGLDNDGDGEVDEGSPPRAPTWYADNDGDGFGDAANPVQTCTAPSGTVSDATDCDDTRSDVFPGAAEVCDEVDNDCDMLVDDDDPWISGGTVLYADADGDGYGDASTAAMACELEEGWTLDATDCDDTSASVSPGAEELPDGGADEDCDELVDEYLVCADGSGYFTTIQEAADALPANSTVELCPGVYEEDVFLTQGLTIVGGGDHPEAVVLRPATGDWAVMGNAGYEGYEQATFRFHNLSVDSAYGFRMEWFHVLEVDTVDFCPGSKELREAVYGNSGGSATVTRSHFCAGTAAGVHGVHLNRMGYLTRFEFTGNIVEADYVADEESDAYVGLGLYNKWQVVSNNLFVGGRQLVFTCPGPLGYDPEITIQNNTFVHADLAFVYSYSAGSNTARSRLLNNILSELGVTAVGAGTPGLWQVDTYENVGYRCGTWEPIAWSTTLMWRVEQPWSTLYATNGRREEELDCTATSIITDGSTVADPLFAPDSLRGSFALAEGSPAIDAGTGDPDPDGSPPDLGAFGGPGGDWYLEVPWQIP